MLVSVLVVCNVKEASAAIDQLGRTWALGGEAVGRLVSRPSSPETGRMVSYIAYRIKRNNHNHNQNQIKPGLADSTKPKQNRISSACIVSNQSRKVLFWDK